jgi:hypothetical protein
MPKSRKSSPLTPEEEALKLFRDFALPNNYDHDRVYQAASRLARQENPGLEAEEDALDAREKGLNFTAEQQQWIRDAKELAGSRVMAEFNSAYRLALAMGQLLGAMGRVNDRTPEIEDAETLSAAGVQ